MRVKVRKPSRADRERLVQHVRITPTADHDSSRDVRMTIDATKDCNRTIGVGSPTHQPGPRQPEPFLEHRKSVRERRIYRLAAKLVSKSPACQGQF